MHATPYLFFDGRCEEAIEFYRGALKAEVIMLMRFGDSPDKTMKPTPGTENKVMHGELKIGGVSLFVSDGQCTGKPNFQGFSLALTVDSEADADKLFNGLSDGGRVEQPLIKTFFSPKFGMLADRFGVGWMIMVGKK